MRMWVRGGGGVEVGIGSITGKGAYCSVIRGDIGGRGRDGRVEDAGSVGGGLAVGGEVRTLRRAEK
jgi:hypothetical protein